MPNRTYEIRGVEYIDVDLPIGPHGTTLIAIRADPECMNYPDDFIHSYCGGPDVDEVLASEFRYDAVGLQSTFKKEVREKGSHEYRIMQYPQYFTEEEIAQAYVNVNRRPPDPVERLRGRAEEDDDGARYVTFPVHTSRSPDLGLMQVQPSDYVAPDFTQNDPDDLSLANIQSVYEYYRQQMHEARREHLRMYRDSDWGWMSDPTPSQQATDEPFPMPEPQGGITEITDFTFPALERRQAHYQVNNDTNFTEGINDV